MKKHILIVFHDSNPKSGAIASMLDLLEYLSKLSIYEIHALIPNTNNGLREELDQMKVACIESFIPSSRFSVKKNKFLQTLSFLKSILLQFPGVIYALTLSKNYKFVDLVYTNSSSTYMGSYISWILQKPHIWHFREFGRLDQNVEQILIGNLFNKFLSRFCNHIIYISNALKNHYLSLGIDVKYSVLYNDLRVPKIELYTKGKSDFSISRSDGFDREFKILITGTICEGKGQRFAIDAVSKIIQLGHNVKLSIAGDDTTSYAKSLKDYAKTLMLSDHVRFLGFCDDMSQVRESHDLALVASESEAFGRVTIEAMSSGLPVLVSGSGANSELVKDHFNGFIYKSNDIDSLVNSLLYLMNNIAQIDLVTKNAKRFSKNFTANKCACEVSSLICRILM